MYRPGHKFCHTKVDGQEMAHNFSYNHWISVKIISFESFSNVEYISMIYFGFIVIKKFLESNNARKVKNCMDKSLVVSRM